MILKDLTTGRVVQHFKRELMSAEELVSDPKKYLYEIICCATHTENEEVLVVYRAMYGDKKKYARPADMFLSEVDREKYPNIKQQYRFEKYSGTVIGHPKYCYGDKVHIIGRNGSVVEGIVEIIDAWGTFEQHEEPSYDVMVTNENCLYKHIRESQILD